jgi:CBS domain-containing protein
MAENEVGTLVVMNAGGVKQPIGVLTDRDIAIRCVASGLDCDVTQVSQVMSKPAYTMDEDTPIEEAITMMARTATRRLVVTRAGGELAGILSLDDVLDLLVAEARSIGQLLDRQQPHLTA